MNAAVAESDSFLSWACAGSANAATNAAPRTHDLMIPTTSLLRRVISQSPDLSLSPAIEFQRQEAAPRLQSLTCGFNVPQFRVRICSRTLEAMEKLGFLKTSGTV